jgi:hypothetical protein
MADQNQIFYHNASHRVPNIFSILFMHSVGLSKTQAFKKVFSKIQDVSWKKNRIWGQVTKQLN